MKTEELLSMYLIDDNEKDGREQSDDTRNILDMDELNNIIANTEDALQSMHKITSFISSASDTITSLKNSLLEMYQMREGWLRDTFIILSAPIITSNIEDTLSDINHNNEIDKLELKLKFDRVKELHDNRLIK